MRLVISEWSPSFIDNADGPSRSQAAELSLEVERPAAQWEPVDAAGPLPSSVILVDGVQRFDAHVELTDGSERQPGLCASWAAGAVACHLGDGKAEIVTAEVERALFTRAESAPSSAYYPLRSVPDSELEDLTGAVQLARHEVELAVSAAVADQSDLLVVDGTLRGRATLPRAVGYIKSHHRSYLTGAQAETILALRAGQRSPVFHLTTDWDRYSWYLRLPGSNAQGWSGIARLEASSDLSAEEAVALANISTRAVPRLASVAYKDTRAPQNLTPIAGLERHLKRKLGDARLLLRSLRAEAQ